MAVCTLLISVMVVYATGVAAQQLDTDPSTTTAAWRVFGVGDSIMLGGSDALTRVIPGIQIDAAIGRQAATGIDILRARAAAGEWQDVLIFHLGTNGPLTDRQIDSVMETASPSQRVLFVSLTVPRDWEAPNNALLADAALRYPNAVYVDWHALSIGRLDLLWDDGIHLRPAGADAYAALIARYSTPSWST